MNPVRVIPMVVRSVLVAVAETFVRVHVAVVVAVVVPWSVVGVVPVPVVTVAVVVTPVVCLSRRCECCCTEDQG